MPQNLVEKIAERHAVGLPEGVRVHAGDFLMIRPRHVMTHDNTSAVIAKFETMGAPGIHDGRQPVFCLDHDIQNRSEENLAKYAAIQAFAERHGLAFFPAGRGIGHQVMIEEGFVRPGWLVVASDSHSNLYGALGALGAPVVRTDAAAIWATGQTWWQVPEVVRVTLAGRLRPGVTGKDVIIALCGAFADDDVLNCCVEFAGPGLAELPMAGRLAIANMTTEWGALAGVFPFDEVARGALPDPEWAADALEADPDAAYVKELELDLSAVAPFVAGPNDVKTIASIAEMAARRVRIDRAYILSCVNGRAEDFEAAADVLRGKKVAPGVTLFIAAASNRVEDQARRSGAWDALLQAGAVALPPGCGPCIGLGDGVLRAGEVGISATNRNFKGRMGDPSAEVYLASPAVVAASALAGFICGPEPGEPDARERLLRAATQRQSRPAPQPPTETELLPGFPAQVEGELLLVPKNNLNTDGIYGKEYTYREGMAPEAMGRAAMLNYDPKFQKIAREGDILVGGFNFGCGSSREQAATALKFRGVRLVIAGSFSQTYKRNAFNNGYVVLECPSLVESLRGEFGNGAPTIRTGRTATVDFSRSRVVVGDREYPFSPLGPVAQELIVEGGFEPLIAKRLGRPGPE